MGWMLRAPPQTWQPGETQVEEAGHASWEQREVSPSVCGSAGPHWHHARCLFLLLQHWPQSTLSPLVMARAPPPLQRPRSPPPPPRPPLSLVTRTS